MKKTIYTGLVCALLFWAEASSAQNIRCGNARTGSQVINAVDGSAVDHATSSHVSSCSPQYIIPVVFHVFHNNGAQQVPLAQIQSGLDKVNEDFSGANTDFSTVDPAFKDIRGTMNLKFVLAGKDPSGNPTNGVVYHSTRSGFGKAGTNDNIIKQFAWDNYKYMNVYIMLDLYSDGATNNSGIAWLPSKNMSDNNTARVVYNYRYLGNTGSSIADDNFQSVLTHEFGHWLNLSHTFEGGCSGSDFVDDTPPTEQSAGCQAGTMSCGHVVNGENYMDYSSCYKMFTKGQVERMRDALDNHPARRPLWQLSNLQATGTFSHYVPAAPTAEFSASTLTIEEGPTVFFKDLSCGYPDRWTWTIEGGLPAQSTEQHPYSRFDKEGMYSVDLIAANSTGTSAKYTVKIEVKKPLQNCILKYDFENETLQSPPTGWTDNSPSNGKWKVAREVSHPWNEVGNFSSQPYHSVHSLYSRSNWYNGAPKEILLVSPEIDLGSAATPKLSYYDLRGWDPFWPVNKPEHVVEVLVGSSSGGPWTVVKKDTAHKNGFQKWRRVGPVDLAAFKGQKIYIGFRTNTQHYYWRIDDVCISEEFVATSVKEQSAATLNMYPNPVGSRLHFRFANKEYRNIELYNIYGKKVLSSITDQSFIDLSGLSQGLYVVKVKEKGGAVLTGKVKLEGR